MRLCIPDNYRQGDDTEGCLHSSRVSVYSSVRVGRSFSAVDFVQLGTYLYQVEAFSTRPTALAAQLFYLDSLDAYGTFLGQLATMPFVDNGPSGQDRIPRPIEAKRVFPKPRSTANELILW